MTLTPRPAPSADLPPQCVTQYAALLDLARLAHRYGSNSSAFVNAIDELAGSLDACLSRARGSVRSPDMRTTTPLGQSGGHRA